MVFVSKPLETEFLYRFETLARRLLDFAVRYRNYNGLAYDNGYLCELFFIFLRTLYYIVHTFHISLL